MLGRPLTYHSGGELGPAFGAARLGRLAATVEDPKMVCTRPPTAGIVEPAPDLQEGYQARWEQFRALYPTLKERFSKARA